MTEERAGTKETTGEAVSAARTPSGADPAVCFLEGKSRHMTMWGMSLRERLERQFAGEGIAEIVPFADLAKREGSVILLREDCVIDPPLIPSIVKRLDFALRSDLPEQDWPIAVHTHSKDAAAAAEAMRNEEALPDLPNLTALRPSELDATFWSALRKRETPYARTVSPDRKAETEWRVFMGTYKGATDFVTKYLWPRPAFHVTRLLAPTAVTPNTVTAASAVCVALAFWLFWEGHHVAGLSFAWLMTFLDTVDGKLARTTLTSSRWGDVFDHGIDLIHPPFWYAAWALGLAAAGQAWSPDVFSFMLTALVGGYIVQRIMEGVAIMTLGVEIHIWRPIDTTFRLVTARRNPNLAILTAVTLISGRADVALELVAWWTIVCTALHGIQLIQALIVRNRDGELTSWMTEPPKPDGVP